MTEVERKQLLCILRALDYTRHNWWRMGVLGSCELEGVTQIVKSMLVGFHPPEQPNEKPDEPNPYG